MHAEHADGSVWLAVHETLAGHRAFESHLDATALRNR